MMMNDPTDDLAAALETLKKSLSLMTSAAQVMRIEAESSTQDARRMRQGLRSTLEQMTREDPNFLERYQHSMLRSIVDLAIKTTGADMGNLQLLEPSSAALHIKSQRGFTQPFLAYFGSVHHGKAVCGTALRKQTRVVVEDVTESPIFVGTPALEVLLDAGVRAVQSTPLISKSGSIVGMISTHWHSPHRPSSRALNALDALARGTGEWVAERMFLNGHSM
jgi:hypothetical protein